MPKFLLTFLTIYLLGFINTKAFAATSRLYDFNKTSDLTDYFNPDLDPNFTNNDYAGLNFTGSVGSTGHEDIWTTKKGFITTGTGDAFELSGYFYNMDLFGYGSLGLSSSNSNSGDGLGRATPENGIGFVFHGGGGYFVNDGVYTEILWPPDLDDNKWYKFTLIVSNEGSNQFNLNILVYSADSAGNTLTLKSMETLSVTNPSLASASKLYSYFGASSVRFSYIDNIKIRLTEATFEEDGTPSVTTTTASNISSSGAQSGGEVTTEKGNSVTDRGVCYSTSQNPTISGNCVSSGNRSGSFSVSLSNLNANALYYYRAFATNTNGTSYGTEYSFRTLGNSNSNNVSNSTKKFKKFTKCVSNKPPQVTWMKIDSYEKDGKKGMLLTWSQLGANLVTIQIDNGTGKFPYSITKTKNDGKEFLANVTALQKIRIIPLNGCKAGDTSPIISRFTHPLGYFKK